MAQHGFCICGRPECEPPPRVEFDYSFTLWPAEGGFRRPLYDVFRLLDTRVELTFTEGEWRVFAASIVLDGFTLRAVVRVPHHIPEPVL